MHHSQNMLESRVFCRRKHPPCRLQLVNLPHPLHPRMIDQILFCVFTGIENHAGSKQDLTMNRVMRQTLLLAIANQSASLDHRPPHPPDG